jgi:PIN domain nuclease of toxin-antitoxin system
LRLLIDTHVILWGYNEPERVSRSASRAMASTQNRCFVSVASLWEIAIKARKGQLSTHDDLPTRIAADPQLTLLPIAVEHAWRIRQLPRLHGDPFDLLLVSQALVEQMTLVTHDRAMAAYGVPIVAT